MPRAELVEAEAFARAHGLALTVRPTAELANEAYRRNDAQRCYVCKHTLFTDMVAYARERGFTTLAFGAITDDALDVRPGARAADELGVVAPLAEAGYGKDEVRDYARRHGLEVADKPASACLASRLPRGTRVTRARLERIDRAEAGLKRLGFGVLRVRDHGAHARLELGPQERLAADALREEIERVLLGEGFLTHELHAYRSPTARAST